MIENHELEKERVLMKNNILVRARYSLTTNESRIFLLILFKLQKTLNKALSCTISYDELSQYIKSPKDRTIKNIHSVLSQLRKKPIYFKELGPDGKTYKWGEYGFINGFEFEEATKIFTIKVPEIIYMIMDNYLKDGYTPNNLMVLMNFRNSNSYRLYDLVRVWSGSKSVINYPINILREYLMLEDRYPLYGDFKKRVLVPAINELNKTDFFEIETKEHKEGRKVTSIDFIVNDKDKRKYFESSVPVIEQDDKTPKGNDEPVVKDLKEEVFYIPYYMEMTAAMTKRFKKDYKEFNFKNKYYEEVLEEAYYLTLEKDNAEILTYRNYKLFKDIFVKKLEQSKPETNYNISELEKGLLGWNDNKIE